jgi:hypothetical protein
MKPEIVCNLSQSPTHSRNWTALLDSQLALSLDVSTYQHKLYIMHWSTIPSRLQILCDLGRHDLKYLLQACEWREMLNMGLAIQNY